MKEKMNMVSRRKFIKSGMVLAAGLPAMRAYPLFNADTNNNEKVTDGLFDLFQSPPVTPKKKSKVRLLGYDKPLKWNLTGDGGVRIEIPEALQSSENRPCEYAWAFKFEVDK